MTDTGPVTGTGHHPCDATLDHAGIRLVCHQWAPHAGVMHHDRDRGAWWDEDGTVLYL